MANEGMLIGVALALVACGPSNERPPVQGVLDAARPGDSGAGDGGLVGDAAPAADATPPPGLDVRVNALSITVRSARRSWLVPQEQSCEFRDGLPFFTAVFPNPANDPCTTVAFAGGDLGLRGRLPDGGVDEWSAVWRCMKQGGSTLATLTVVTSAPYVADGDSVMRRNAQFPLNVSGLAGAPFGEFATVTILGCPVRPSP